MKWAGAVLLLVIALLLLWLLAGDHILSYFIYEPRAHDAIAAAQAACGSGSRTEFARRKVDAEMAIRKVSGARAMELGAVLASELALVGCR